MRSTLTSLTMLLSLCSVGLAHANVGSLSRSSTTTPVTAPITTSEDSARVSERPGALPLETVLWKLGNPALSEQDLSRLQRGLAKFNKSPDVQVADNSNRLHFKYFCAGGKLAVVANGFQAVKCINVAGNTMTIGMGERDVPELSGLMAEGYVGLNAGVSILTGVAILSCDLGNCQFDGEFKHRYYSDYPDENTRPRTKGGTVNGAVGLYGAYLGYYTNGSRTIALAMYQAGLAAEISYSNVYVKTDQD